MTAALAAHNVRLRVAAENMANAESAGYAPQTVHIGSQKDRTTGIQKVTVKKIQRNPGKMRVEYNPNHPQADEHGYVHLPDVNPMIEMVNLQHAKHDVERSMKIYEIATDLRYKMIGMISNR